MDGSPHLPARVRGWSGDSRGHWENDTLVVSTTNFNDELNALGASANLELIERFTRVDPNLLDYQITIEDPKMFTRPIKIAGSFQAAAPGTELMEFACAEGSQTLPNVFGFELAPGRAPVKP